jgi:hypothetical protein
MGKELAALKAQPAPVQPVAYTTGHCEEKAKPRGCQLHNVNCGYPACDRKAVATPPAAQQAEDCAAILYRDHDEKPWVHVIQKDLPSGTKLIAVTKGQP